MIGQPLEYFQALGSRIEVAWRRANFRAAFFPAISSEALERAPAHRDVDLSALLGWALTSVRLPDQHDPEAGFGEPPITVYAGEGFIIAVNLWLTSTTSIHNHAFGGAFQVLSGSSLETQFRFRASQVINDHMASGDLEELQSRVLRPGDTRAIEGERTIHSLFHLEHPSATVVVRTRRDPAAAPQLSYLRPNVALDPLYNPADLLRRKQLLSFLAASNPERVPRACIRYFRRADFVTKFVTLRHCTTLLSPAQGDKMIARARAIDSKVANLVSKVADDHRREAFLIRRRTSIKDTELRFFLALLLNVRGRKKALALVRARHPKRDPVAQVMNWVGALDARPGPDPGTTALGFPLDDVVHMTLEGALRGLDDATTARRIEKAAKRPLQDEERRQLLQLRKALHQSEIFRYILQ